MQQSIVNEWAYCKRWAQEGDVPAPEWSAKALANLYPKIVKKLMALPLPICRLLLQFCIGSRSALARIKVYLLSFLMLSTTVLSSERWKEKMDKLDSSTRCFKSMIDEVALLFMSENESHFSVLYLICTTEQVKMDLYYKAMSNMSGNLYRIAGNFRRVQFRRWSIFTVFAGLIIADACTHTH